MSPSAGPSSRTSAEDADGRGRRASRRRASGRSIGRTSGAAGRSGCTTPALVARTTSERAARVTRARNRDGRPPTSRRCRRARSGDGEPRRATAMRTIRPSTASGRAVLILVSLLAACAGAAARSASTATARWPVDANGVAGYVDEGSGPMASAAASAAPAAPERRAPGAATASAPRSTTPGSSAPAPSTSRSPTWPPSLTAARDGIRALGGYIGASTTQTDGDTPDRLGHLPHPGRALGGRPRPAPGHQRPGHQGRRRAHRRGRGHRARSSTSRRASRTCAPARPRSRRSPPRPSASPTSSRSRPS